MSEPPAPISDADLARLREAPQEAEDQATRASMFVGYEIRPVIVDVYADDLRALIARLDRAEAALKEKA